MSNKPALRERIETALTVMRHRLETEHYDFHYDAKTEALDTILNFLKEELEGLTVSTDNPYFLKDIDGDYYNKYPEFQCFEDGKVKQQSHTIKELKEKMG